MNEMRPDTPQPNEAARARSRGALLRDAWYVVATGDDVPRSKMIHRVVLGEPLLIARQHDGSVFALRDICPHRGILLTHGSFDGNEVQCAYHGWRFDRSGTCTAIPSLVDGQDMDPGRIKVRRYPCQEVQGNIWVFIPEGHQIPEDLPVVPRVPVFDGKPNLYLWMDFPCHVDHAVIGLMDPAHGPYVHRSSVWRSAKTAYAKEKAFSPDRMGWLMDRHTASKNSKAYRIFLGTQPQTEIGFQLPKVCGQLA